MRTDSEPARPDAPGAAEAGLDARWSLEEAGPAQDAEVLALFAQVFGHAMPPERWAWKYRGAALRGTLLRRDGAVVAFYGGMPRAVRGPDGPCLAVQNGDVMVHPSERGVFSRRGAIFRVTQAFLDGHIGRGRRYAFGFGFPNPRAFQVAERLGLYVQGDRMVDLRFGPLDAAGRPFWMLEQALDAGGLGMLDAIWRRMEADWPGLFIPVRDAARWRYRYLEHPSLQYRLLVVRPRIGRPLAAMALREHAGHLEWLDFAGPRAALPHAVAALRRLGGSLGGKPVLAMASGAIASFFEPWCEHRQANDIVIPLRTPQPGDPLPEPWRGRLWLMGGDTDFL